MLKIRLQRVGRRNDPSYRVVVIDSHEGPQSGNHIEIIGTHDPIRKNTNVDTGRAKEWMAKGAQPSGVVHNILVGVGAIEGKKKNVLPKHTPVVAEKEEKDVGDKTDNTAGTTEEAPATDTPEEADDANSKGKEAVEDAPPADPAEDTGSENSSDDSETADEKDEKQDEEKEEKSS